MPADRIHAGFRLIATPKSSTYRSTSSATAPGPVSSMLSLPKETSALSTAAAMSVNSWQPASCSSFEENAEPIKVSVTVSSSLFGETTGSGPPVSPIDAPSAATTGTAPPSSALPSVPELFTAAGSSGFGRSSMMPVEVMLISPAFVGSIGYAGLGHKNDILLMDCPVQGAPEVAITVMQQRKARRAIEVVADARE